MKNYDSIEESPLKVYLKPGDLVQLKHDLTNKPKMLVIEKVNKYSDNEISLVGMKCIWFNENKDICEGIFSTKDLEKI